LPPSGDQAGEMIGSREASAACVVAAVGVGDLELVAAGALDHVGDAGGEHARLAGELFVDVIGDAVRRGAQLRRRCAGRPECRAPPAWARRRGGRGFRSGLRRRAHAAAGHGVGAARLPGRRNCGVALSASGAPASTRRNRPLRSRSARTTEVRAWATMRSPAKSAMATGNAVGAGAGDLDRELGAGGEGANDKAATARNGGNEQGIEFHRPRIIICLVFQGPVGDIQQSVKTSLCSGFGSGLDLRMARSTALSSRRRGRRIFSA
jgi:hypothetical protein